MTRLPAADRPDAPSPPRAPAPPGRRPDGRVRRSWRGAVAAALVVVLALVASACAPNDEEPVLTVNGWSLSRGELREQLQQIADNEGYVAARSEATGEPYRVVVPGTAEFAPEVIAEFLNERITFQLARAEVARRGLAVTDEDRQRAIDTIVPGLASGSSDRTAAPAGSGTTGGTAPDGSADATVGGTTAGSTPARDGRAVLDAFGSYRDVLVDGVANLLVLQDALVTDITSDEQLRQLYDQLKERSATQACVRHLLVQAGTGQADPTTGEPLVPTEEEYAAALLEATELRTRVDAGEDFATLAARTSDDTPTAAEGGDLGCAPPGTYSESFDQAVWTQEIGVVGQPVRSEYGYHLVLVTERGTLTFEEMRDDLLAAVQEQNQQALQSWLTEAARGASVTVDAVAGTWDPETGLVKAVGAVDAAELDLSPEDPANPTPGLVPGPSSTTSTIALPAAPTTSTP